MSILLESTQNMAPKTALALKVSIGAFVLTAFSVALWLGASALSKMIVSEKAAMAKVEFCQHAFEMGVIAPGCKKLP